jgi:hypothetical protein
MCKEKFTENNSHFDEVELSIIKDEKMNLTKNEKSSIFDGLTLDEITFSTMDNEKIDFEMKDKSSIEEMRTQKLNDENREIENIDTEELEREIDEILQRILQEMREKDNTNNT